MCNGLYVKLKLRMVEKQVRQVDLAVETGKSMTYINKRMVGKAAWELDIVYVICDFLDIPYAQLPEYFPPGGKSLK